jgi:aminoglycoside phosphotransferase (APT) family kinase protein
VEATGAKPQTAANMLAAFRAEADRVAAERLGAGWVRLSQGWSGPQEDPDAGQHQAVFRDRDSATVLKLAAGQRPLGTSDLAGGSEDGPGSAARQLPFRAEEWLSGRALGRTRCPAVLERGRTAGSPPLDFVLLEHVPSARPGHEAWLLLDTAQRRTLVADVVAAVDDLHALPPPPWLPGLPPDGRPAVQQHEELRRHLRQAETRLPRHTWARCEAEVSRLLASAEQSAASCEWCVVHGDLWLGNTLVGPDGRLAALIDWDSLCWAPRDCELAAFLHFWHYPQQYCDEGLEPSFPGPLSIEAARPALRRWSRGLAPAAAAERCLLYELASQMQTVAAWSYSDKHRRMLERVLPGGAAASAPEPWRGDYEPVALAQMVQWELPWTPPD